MIIRVHWKIRSEHVHCQVFVAAGPNQQFAKAGDVVLRASEFISLSQGKFKTEFVEEEGND